MTRLSRIIANALLPLLFFSCSYLLLYHLGEGLLEELLLQFVAIGLSTLLAALPPIAFYFLIRSQIKEGFALLTNKRVVLPSEITLGMVLGNRITAWKAFQHRLDTEVCLQGEGVLVYVQLGLNFRIPASDNGKRFIKHFKNNFTVFEAWVQRAIFLASGYDREQTHSLASGALMNEEDERTLCSKFLSALEMQPLKSVELPVDTSGLTINRKVRVKKTGSTIANKLQPSEQQLDDDLTIDDALLSQLGLNNAI